MKEKKDLLLCELTGLSRSTAGVLKTTLTMCRMAASWYRWDLHAVDERGP